MRLIVIRHGQTPWNAQHRYQGQSDTPLSALGRAQAEAVGERLAGEHLDAIYASDLQRARDTAMAIASRHGLTVHADPRLREMAFGEWEGMTFAEMEAADPERLAAWLDESTGVTPPAGESREALAARVAEALAEIRARHPEQTVVLVAHGGTLMTLLVLALNLPQTARWCFRIGHATVSELHLHDDDTAVLALLNDGCHLEGLE